ncbi:hypothetical protein RBB50_009343 [Rhinocladiella similis]
MQMQMTIHKHNENPWLTSPHTSGLISLPARGISLFSSCSGPARRHHTDDPIVIFFTGAGGPSALYVKVQEHLSAFVRTFFFDRAGYDRSSLPTHDGPLIAEDGAHDLACLLDTLDISPPYVLVGHSFGGVPLREFMHVALREGVGRMKMNTEPKNDDHGRSKDHALPREPPVKDVIAGIVLVDTATELMLSLYPRVPAAELVAVSEDVDWEAVTHLREQSGMTEREWDCAMAAAARTRRNVADREDTHVLREWDKRRSQR